MTSLWILIGAVAFLVFFGAGVLAFMRDRHGHGWSYLSLSLVMLLVLGMIVVTPPISLPS